MQNEKPHRSYSRHLYWEYHVLKSYCSWAYCKAKLIVLTFVVYLAGMPITPSSMDVPSLTTCSTMPRIRFRDSVVSCNPFPSSYACVTWTRVRDAVEPSSYVRLTRLYQDEGPCATASLRTRRGHASLREGVGQECDDLTVGTWYKLVG